MHSSSIFENGMVATAVRKIPAVSIGTIQAQALFPFSPNSVEVHEVCGGFNSVVEISAPHCLRVFANQVQPTSYFQYISSSALQQFIDNQEALFDNNDINQLNVSSNMDWWYALNISFVAKKLDFSDPNIVCITFEAQVELLTSVVPPKTVDLETQMQTGTDLISAIRAGYPITRGRAHRHSDPASMRATGPVDTRAGKAERKDSGRRAYAMKASPAASAEFIARYLDDIILKPIDDEPDVSMAIPLGSCDIELCCDYVWESSDALCRLDVFADLSTSKIEFGEMTGDLKRFHDQFLINSHTVIESRLAPISRAHLTPTISLVGQNPANQPVTEIAEFHVYVFHVSEGASQAIAAAFDVRPGCHGIVEDVRHFIGECEYGVISDECVIESVFMNKWRLGGFDRGLRLTKTIEVARNGNLEDAELRGHLILNTLDYVTVDTNSDTRTDYIRIGGKATSEATSIRLNDGTILGPGDVDFGDPEDTPWSLFTSLEIEPEWSSDPEMRDFQMRAHQDAYRHVARPFAMHPSAIVIVTPTYTRIEGVTKYAYILGRLFVWTGAYYHA